MELSAEQGATQYRRPDNYYTAGQGQGDETTNEAMADKFGRNTAEVMQKRAPDTPYTDESLKLDDNGMYVQDTLKFITEEHQDYWYHENLRGEEDGAGAGYGVSRSDSNYESELGGIVTTPYVPFHQLRNGIRIQLRAQTNHN